MLLFASWACAQQTRPPEVINLSVHAAPATRPSLRYKLLPEVIDQHPGNGAPLYLAAARVGPDPKAADNLTSKAGERFRDLPLDQLARADVEGALKPFDERMRIIEVAARREDAVWESTLREQGAFPPLSYLNDMRINARLLSLMTRWQIARHDWDGAGRTLQTAFGMSQQMNNRALLVQGLIETGIADLLLDRVTEWCGEAGAPNLYWALTDLPSPFVDLRSVRQWEEAMIYFTFPELAARDPENITAGQWKKIFERIGQICQANGETSLSRLQMTWLVASKHAVAKQSLIDGGIPAEKLAGMSVNQVVGLYLFRQYQAAADEAWKAWQLPYWQGVGKPPAPEGSEWEARRARIAENPFLVLIPVVRSARLQFARVDRKIALLRVIESLRDFAASNERRFPASLQELNDLPAPINPVSGKAFTYQSTGDTAVLEVEADYSGGPAMLYRLTVAH